MKALEQAQNEIKNFDGERKRFQQQLENLVQEIEKREVGNEGNRSSSIQEKQRMIDKEPFEHKYAPDNECI